MRWLMIRDETEMLSFQQMSLLLAAACLEMLLDANKSCLFRGKCSDFSGPTLRC